MPVFELSLQEIRLRMKGCDSMYSRGIACGCTDLSPSGMVVVKVSLSCGTGRGPTGKFKISRGMQLQGEPNMKKVKLDRAETGVRGMYQMFHIHFTAHQPIFVCTSNVCRA